MISSIFRIVCFSLSSRFSLMRTVTISVLVRRSYMEKNISRIFSRSFHSCASCPESQEPTHSARMALHAQRLRPPPGEGSPPPHAHEPPVRPPAPVGARRTSRRRTGSRLDRIDGRHLRCLLRRRASHLLLRKNLDQFFSSCHCLPLTFTRERDRPSTPANERDMNIRCV